MYAKPEVTTLLVFSFLCSLLAICFLATRATLIFVCLVSLCNSLVAFLQLGIVELEVITKEKGTLFDTLGSHCGEPDGDSNLQAKFRVDADFTGEWVGHVGFEVDLIGVLAGMWAPSLPPLEFCNYILTHFTQLILVPHLHACIHMLAYTSTSTHTHAITHTTLP